MSTSLAELEAARRTLLQQFTGLGDMRRGSVSAFTRKCGKPNCHCAQPNDPGHGPQYRLTRNLNGKTTTETFASATALRKARREVEEFHRFRELSRELLAVNEQICQRRPVGETLSAVEKKRPKRSSRKSLRK
jgi:hypothetical protein